MRALLIRNPAATRTDPRTAAEVVGLLASHMKLDVEDTKRDNHARFLAAGAVHEGYELVLTLGGDGTMNEALQAVAGTSTKLATIPGGSTNVWARTLGLPNDPVRATHVILRCLREGVERDIVPGQANGRLFAFNAGFGIDAAVVREVDRRHRFKRAAGQGAFLYWGAVTLARGWGRKTARISVDSGDLHLSGLRTVVCCNTSPFTYLARWPVVVCPDADPSRGLSVLGLERVSVPALLRVIRRAVTGRRVDGLSWARSAPECRTVTLEATAPLAWQVDGDYMGEVRTVRIGQAATTATVVA